MSLFGKGAMILFVSTLFLFSSIKSLNLGKYRFLTEVNEEENFHRIVRSPSLARPDDNVLHQLCGARLSAAVQMVCKRPLPVHRPSKRSSSNGFPARTRYPRSIIDECCKRPCTFRYLRDFCVPDVLEVTTTTEAPVLPKPTPTRKGLPMEILRAIYKFITKSRNYSKQVVEEKEVPEIIEVETTPIPFPASLVEDGDHNESQTEPRYPLPFEANYADNEEIPGMFYA